ncbi:histidine phosphatase family protein [Photobacterium kasasachensis]|uniref:histidine phosphatase family protein n=1 Tax=Photobacterium kasasachensis TaxID=2910240 RepID=UPI003D10F0C2
MEIVLIRHGKPTGSTNPKLTPKEFALWVRSYNFSEISIDSKPPAYLKPQLCGHYIVSSDLRRAIHSATLCLLKEPDLKLRDAREMDVPRHKIPFILSVNNWLLINRFLWLLGFNAKVESLKDAQARAKSVALDFAELANQHQKVAVFGHGLINRSVTKELERLGWRCTEKDSSYWGITKLTLS